MYALAISVYFAVASATIVFLKVCPPLNALLQYGKVVKPGNVATGSWQQGVEAVASVTVPKAWFSHFYIVFAVLVAPLVCFACKGHHEKYAVLWTMFMAQAARRVYESFYVTRYGARSEMNVIHWLVGLSFYVGMSLNLLIGFLQPPPKASAVPVYGFALVLYGVAAYDQYLNHLHLAQLVKYTVPTRGLFQYVACAHYTDEVAIYTLVALVALTGGVTAVDVNFCMGLLFVIVNLGVSSLELLRFYKGKFERYNVRRGMLPGIL